MTGTLDSPPPPSPTPPTDPVGLLRDIVDRGRTGALEWPSLAEAAPLVFREGRLLLRKEGALALRGQPVADAAPGADTLASLENPAETRLLRILTARVARPRGPASFREGPVAVGERLVGPLQARPLLMEGAVVGRSEAELLAALGGEETQLRAAGARPAIQTLARYPEPLRRLLSRLAEPARLRDLLRLSSSSRVATLADLRRLQAVGLVMAAPERRIHRAESDSGEKRLVDLQVLARFHERIERSLADRPLDLEPEEHRELAVAMLRDGGDETYYELFELSETATTEEIAAAYEGLARVVHPQHGAHLGLSGGEEVLGALFERLTQGYRTLSDPDRRRDYDLAIGAGGSQLRDLSEEEMERVRKRMAASSYRRARENLAEEDFHYAVELMRDAVRWDPQARYWSLLGQAQLPNPKWVDHALESFREAIRLDPQDLKYRLQLAQALEQLERTDEALEAYRSLLEASPGLDEAREAVERLEARRRVESPGMMDRLRSWLGLSD